MFWCNSLVMLRWWLLDLLALMFGEFGCGREGFIWCGLQSTWFENFGDGCYQSDFVKWRGMMHHFTGSRCRVAFTIGLIIVSYLIWQEEGYEEIRGEIEMLQQCSHPNVVRYLGSYQGEEYLWVWICNNGFLIELDRDTLFFLYVKQLLFILIFLFCYVFADCYGVLRWW